MELQVGVKIILQNKEGKFLLLWRNLEKYPDIKKSDSLDIVGGRIKIGVPLLENLKREIFEETGLVLTEEPRLLVAQDILKTDKHVVRLTYLGKTNDEPKLSEEHSSYVWLSVEEMKNQEGLDKYFKEVFLKFFAK
jgi:ADP-ribose pyrophosphatase YjhB (NUDIX family)